METEIYQTYAAMAWPLVSGAALGIVILVGGWLVSKSVERLVRDAFRRGRLDEALGRFFGSLGRYTVLAATLITALGAVGIETTSLLTVLASAGLAIGLALQGSLSNFASGVMLLFFRPFDLGDFVTAGGETGTVKDIGLFASVLVTPANETITVPNSAIMGGNITNFTRQGTRRATISVGVEYGTPVDRVMDVLTRAAERADLVLADPEPGVALVGFGASSVDYVVLCWSKAEDFLAMQHNVRRSIYEHLDEAGINIPFDQVVMHQAVRESIQAAK